MRRAVVLLLLCAGVAITSPAQTLTTLHSFAGSPNDGNTANAALVQGSDGNFYGTTVKGGDSAHICQDGCGTIFKVTPAGTVTILHSFCVTYPCSDGADPYSPLVQGTDGNFYGTAYGLGKFGGGTVFRITPAGALTALYEFCSLANCADGLGPYAGLVQATDGNFYGTTWQGGASGHGTVFKMTPAGALTTLHSFCALSNCVDGIGPYAGLVQASDGNFYGTTYEGGSVDYGTVFKITPAGTLTTLYSFCSKANCADGYIPYATLVQATDGNLYGSTTQGAGTYGDGGTVFKITLSGALTTLYSFCSQSNCTDGTVPQSALVQASDGNFYGTTQQAGGTNCNNNPNHCGTVFKITPAGGLTTLHRFDYTDGQWPIGGLVQATDGNYYGTTYTGGAHSLGTVFGLQVPVTYTLTVSTSGSGTVTSTDGFINCPGTCSYSYAPNTPVTLNATPAQGWLFGAWSGCDATNNNVCTVTMNTARNVTATFVLGELLTVTVAGSGTVVSGEINCGSVCSHLYKQGTQVKLTALPGAGSTLSAWAGCDTMQGDYCTVTMLNAKNVTATFATVQVTLTSLTLKPASVKGGLMSIGILTLSAAAPPGGVGVGVSSNNLRVAHPPALVEVPGGATSVNFVVRTSPVTQKTFVQITATANSSHVSATLTVNPR